MHFENFSLPQELQDNLAQNKYINPTEIQEKAIPLLLKSNKNFIGVAQTGTGKTMAFLLPLISKMKANNSTVQSIILAPTRELASQIENEFLKISKNLGLRSLCVYGGTIYDKQINALKNDRPQLIVGTPGRIIDLFDKKVLNISNVQTCVLDEADEMLNMGFLDDVKYILNRLKSKKQLIMFSATMPKSIKKLIHDQFASHNLVEIKKKTISSENVEECYYVVRNKHFKEALARLIDHNPRLYAMVFCRTKLESREVGDDLVMRGHSAVVLNGDMGQAERDAVMTKFKNKKAMIMVCTDVAARGIDVDNLTHVFNYGLPQDEESYVHRIGRTGRHNSKGESHTIIGPTMAFAIRAIEKHTKQKIKYAKLPSIKDLKETMVKTDLESAKFIIEAVQTKGDNFKTEIGFDAFKEKFEGLPEDELLKILFTWKFNKSMRRYNNLENIEDKPSNLNSGKTFQAQRRRNQKKRRR